MRCLKLSLSSMVRVSAFAMTGTMFTKPWRCFMNSTSIGRRLEGEGQRKGGMEERVKI